jgi:DNA-binding CsgD family transcriptional regulator
MTLDFNETARLSALIGKIYDAVLDSTVWETALEGACDFVGGVSANLFWQDAVDHSLGVLHRCGTNPEYEESYLTTYAALNPLFPAMSFIEPGIVVGGADLMPHEEFAETRFFKEWVQPQGYVDMVGVNLQRYSTSAACFAIRRGAQQGYVDEPTRWRMELLAPHVRRAVLISREIQGQAQKSGTLEALLDGVAAGVFLVGPEGRLSLVNDAGRHLLREGGVVAERAGKLSATIPAANRALRAAIAAASVQDNLLQGGQRVAVSLTGEAKPLWLAHILPLSSGARLRVGLGYCASAAVFVRKAEPPVTSGIETIAHIYALRPSEIRVLQAMAGGGSVAEIADALGLSLGTVKTHLAALFAKTGTGRRADLIAAVMAHGNPLG